MLYGTSTKFGVGITLFGDDLDLKSLDETITSLAQRSPLKDNNNILHMLGDDVRGATIGFGDKNEYGLSEYRGKNILWPVFLVQVGLLRWSAGFQHTSQEDQSNLYRLEHCAESALKKIDAQIAAECVEWLKNFSGFPTTYLMEYVFYVTRNYVSTNLDGKARIKKLAETLHSTFPMSPEYRAYQTRINQIAKKKGCDPHELTDLSEWPKFKW
jgi:hypothetical protein